MQMLLATTNPHKLEEVRAAIGGAAIGWQLLSEAAAELGRDLPEPVEDRDTFEGNAQLKARHYARLTRRPCVADDSGLEVKVLGGAPGVRSARYSGVVGPRAVVDPANNAHLLRQLAGAPVDGRSARFVCALCYHHPAADRTLTVRGTVAGRILLPEEADDPEHPERGRGSHGFGYDSLFLITPPHPHAGLTTAQLTPDQKNAVSHRGTAARLLQPLLRNITAPQRPQADSD